MCLTKVLYICRWTVRQCCLIFQNLVKYHLAVCYSQQYHTGINLNHGRFILIAIHIMVILAFFCAVFLIISISYWPELSYVMKNKRVYHTGNIMSKRHGNFTENCTISFANEEIIGNVPEFWIWQILEDHLWEMIIKFIS